MKKSAIKFVSLTFASAIASTIVVLPLVNMKKTTNKNETLASDISNDDATHDISAEMDDYRVKLTDKSYYTISFRVNHAKHPDWGVFGVLADLCIDDDDTIENLQIPATVIQDGKEYKVRRLNTRSNGSIGSGNIKCLDLSKAEWLITIEKNCFECRKGWSPKIRSVNFNGAKRLTTIGTSAFHHQFFDTSLNFNNNVINLLGCPSLTTIDSFAFNQCCDDNKNIFNGIIFPPSLKEVGIDAFSSDNEACRIKFKKVIFTNPNPPTNLFRDGIPRVADPLGLDILVPHGCADKYINHTGFDKTYAKNVYESTIGFDSSKATKGNLKVSAIRNNPGFDEGAWIPGDFDSPAEAHPESRLFVNAPNAGDFYVDSKGHLSWKEDIVPGEYKIRIYGYKYDSDNKRKMSFVYSDEISLSVFDAKISGGSSQLYASFNQAGKDSGSWKLDIDTSHGAQPITEKEFSIFKCPDEIKNNISIGKTDGVVSWTAIQDTECYGKQYPFVIKCKFKNGSDNYLELLQTVYFNVSVLQAMKLTYRTSAFDQFQPYTGQEINITSDKSVTFRIEMPDGWSWSLDAPKLSIQGIEPKSVAEEEKTFEFTFYGTQEVGKYQFDAHSFARSQDKSTVYPIYSAYSFNVNVTNGSLIDTTVPPNEINIQKTKAGSQTFKVVNADNAVITDVQANYAPWNGDNRLADQLLKFEIDPDDLTSVIVSWSDKYSPLDDKPAIDSMDIMLDVFIEDTTTNARSLVHKSLSVIASNKCKIEYEGKEAKIEAILNKSQNNSKNFIYKVNDGSATSFSGDIECTCENEILSSCISMKPGNDNTAYLNCDLSNVTTGDLPEGLYDVYVYVTDENNLTVCYTKLVIEVTLKAELSIAPDSINFEANVAGKWENKLETRLGDEIVTNPTYTIDGLGADMWVEDGYITWNDKIEEGTHEVLLTATVVKNAEEYKAYKYITFNALTASISNAPSKLNIVPNKSGSYDLPLQMYIGNQLVENPTYTIEGLNNNIWVNNEKYICWNDKIDEGTHNITLKATADLYGHTYTTYTSIKVVALNSKIYAPTSLEIVANKSGKSTTLLETRLGDDVITNPTYTITGLKDNMWVENGYITWNDKIAKGTYNVILTSTFKQSGVTFTTSTKLQINVKEQGEGGGTNIPAIVGGTMAGVTVATGAGVGIGVGVKKHKQPKKHKK